MGVPTAAADQLRLAHMAVLSLPGHLWACFKSK